jgi:D-beta-D-heptose 7-phosphate kinase/D-beta-D-heptose 1-phosphate adenosyltransferase
MQTIRNIWINGCFDVLHRGHIELFKYAKELGGFVIVGIDSDTRVKELKGNSRPINNHDDRKFFLESIEYIDKVVVFGSEQELKDYVSFFKPRYMIVGSDYKDKNVIGSQYAKELIFFDRVGDYSTTNILERK